MVNEVAPGIGQLNNQERISELEDSVATVQERIVFFLGALSDYREAINTAEELIGDFSEIRENLERRTLTFRREIRALQGQIISLRVELMACRSNYRDLWDTVEKLEDNQRVILNKLNKREDSDIKNYYLDRLFSTAERCKGKGI